MALQKLKAGFAKIQGEDFEYYVQSYSVMIGRNSKKSRVDLDLAAMSAREAEGGGMNISRTHARIFFDFEVKCFRVEVLGKNGVHLNGELMPCGCPPFKLNSQDLLRIGDHKFYFLLPCKDKKAASSGAKARADLPNSSGKRRGRPTSASKSNLVQKKKQKLGSGRANGNAEKNLSRQDGDDM